MKITDVTLTLFAWDDIPATSYAAHTGKFSGSSKIGLLAIATDQGITGHAFLGSAYYAADLDGQSLVKYLKPILMGQNPLDRERLYQALWRRSRTTTVRTIGACPRRRHLQLREVEAEAPHSDPCHRIPRRRA